ncbi:MAG: hypothetical protein WC955_11865 [Elusimicrobiota bacterium]
MPVEIKFTKSPNIRMAAVIEKGFSEYKLFSQEGYIVCMVNEDIRMSKNVVACNIQSFLGKLRSVI